MTTAATTPSAEEFSRVVKIVSTAVTARVSLIQLREKNLNARVLYELTERAAALTSGSVTRLLVNDRADIARAAAANGVHLTSRSVRAATIRETFGNTFLIGVSTHSLAEACIARDEGADLVVFGPIFETGSKRIYGEPAGLSKLEEVVREVRPFPVLALGGITLNNAGQCLCVGAAGIAGISLFNDAADLALITQGLCCQYRER